MTCRSVWAVMSALAVIPGRSNSALLSTDSTPVYVTTPSLVWEP